MPKSNTYVLTPDGQRCALTYANVGRRLLPPLLSAPPELRAAYKVIASHVDTYLDRARLRPAA